MQRLKPSWFNGVDPFEALALNDTVSKFKELYAKGRYLESLMEKYLLNDKHLTFTMVPSVDYGYEIAQQEVTRQQAEIAKHGSPTEALKTLKAKELELLEIQEKAKQEDLSCLPS